MLVAAVLLGILAVMLAWPAPIVLGRATWPLRAPGAALLLWQSIALAGGLSILGALLTLGLLPYGGSLPRASRAFVSSIVSGRAIYGPNALYLLALGAAILLGAHLVLNLVLTIVATERQRRRHRQLLMLLASPDPSRPDTQLIDNRVPVAYCLPGARSITVFSEGLLELLTPEQLGAVVAHERAHSNQRHDLLLIAFRAWHMSLPWFPTAYRAEREVGLLVEVLADDRARRLVANETLATAISLVTGSRTDVSEELVDGSLLPVATQRQTLSRVTRLLEPDEPVSFVWRLGVAALAVGLVAVPTLLLFTPVG